MYAVIATGGKQYRVQEGDTLEVERLTGDGDTVQLRPVMLVDDDGNVTVAPDALERATVTATVLGHDRDRKITVFKYKNKTGYRRKQGHRQSRTRLRVDEIRA